MQRRSEPPHDRGFSLFFSRSPYRHQVFQSASRADVAPFGLEASTEGFNMRPNSAGIRGQPGGQSVGLDARLRCIRNSYTVGTSAMESYSVDPTIQKKNIRAIDRTMARKNESMQSVNARNTTRLRNAKSIIDTGRQVHEVERSPVRSGRTSPQESKRSIFVEEPPFVVTLAPSWRQSSQDPPSINEPPLRLDAFTNTHTHHQHIKISNPAAPPRKGREQAGFRAIQPQITEDERLLSLHQ